MNIFLEESAVTDIKNLYKDDVVNWANLKVFNKLEDENKIDLAVTIGGDGTILWTCSLFQNRLVPPIITFGMVEKNNFNIEEKKKKIVNIFIYFIIGLLKN